MALTFVPDLPILAAYAAASVVLNLTPGPDMTFCLSKTIGQSRPAGFAALAGVSLGLVVHSVLVAAGLSVVLAASATAFTVLKIVGAAYLAWLAPANFDEAGTQKSKLDAAHYSRWSQSRSP